MVFFIIIGIIIAVILLILLMKTLFFAVKIGIMIFALGYIYKKFPSQKLNNFQLSILGIITFIVLLMIGKSVGAFAVGDVPKAIQPLAIDFTPLTMILMFIIGVLVILYFNKRKIK